MNVWQDDNFIWLCPEGVMGEALGMTSYWQLTVMGLWWLSQLIVAGHIWWPRQNRLDKIEKFVDDNDNVHK